jgi:methyltransferase (TIGR00027 family)
MIHNTKPSQTALAVALIRAASYQESNIHSHSEDAYAHYFIPPLMRFLIKFPKVRTYIQTHLPDQTYQYVVDRTNYIDMVTKDCLSHQCNQVVIVGAGYDSRSMRFQSSGKAKFYECDLSATQKQKISILHKNKLDVSSTHYCQLDLNTINLTNINLPNFCTQEKTLFVLEGLLMYLPIERIKTLFKGINNIAAPESELVFDVMHEHIEASANIVAKQGEPYCGYISKKEIPELLSQFNMNIIDWQSTIRPNSSIIRAQT